MVTDMYAVARQHDLPVLVPPERNINHPGFIKRLEGEIGPTVALSFGCLQIYKKALLDCFDRVVNYHNGRLPAYGGLHATAWEIYNGEARSGYTFHLMDTGIDTGNVLLRGSVPIPETPVSMVVDYEKLKRASAQLTPLLDLVASADPGTPQGGPGGYYSAADFKRITTIERPRRFTYAELQRRLRAFDLLWLNINGTWLRVSRLRRLGRPSGRCADMVFTTADHVQVMADRFDYKPRWLQRLKTAVLKR